MNRLLPCLTAMLLFTGIATATDVSGDITTTTWAKANSPYRVTDSISVPTGNTLTIEPGVDVLFDKDVPFVVEGAIHVAGTEIDSVRFVKGIAEWGGIRISGGDSSSFTYTRLSDGNADGYDTEELGSGQGGGIYCGRWNTRLSMDHCMVSKNASTGSGGGLASSDSFVYLADCSFVGNTSSLGGAVFAEYGHVMTMTRCSISGNSASGGGAAIKNYYTTMELVSCMIRENHTDGIGAIVSSDARLMLTGCTVSVNTAAFHGGIYCSTGPHRWFDVALTNCIVWNNTPKQFSWWRCMGGLFEISINYSCIEGGYEGTGNISADPRFVDTVIGDFRLQSGSPCIGAGESGADMGAFGWITTDSKNSVVFPLVYLRQNTPNPFNPTTTIPFTLADDGAVSLRIYNVMGQQVRTLVRGHQKAGSHTVTWNGLDDRGNAVASGVYLYRLTVGKTVRVRRMTLVR
jgi:hypothetical protein